MTRWFKAMTLALALLVGVALPAEARHGRGHGRHARRIGITRHVNNANPTPGVPRRVRRGRNLTPGVPRGPIGNRVGTLPIIRDGRGRGRDHDDMIRTERDRDRDLAGSVGHGVGMGRGGGRGHGRKP